MCGRYCKQPYTVHGEMKNPLVHVYITDNHCYCYLLSVDSDSFALLRLRCVVMKIGLVMVEYQDLETHLNLR